MALKREGHSQSGQAHRNKDDISQVLLVCHYFLYGRIVVKPPYNEVVKIGNFPSLYESFVK